MEKLDSSTGLEWASAQEPESYVDASEGRFRPNSDYTGESPGR